MSEPVKVQAADPVVIEVAETIHVTDSPEAMPVVKQISTTGFGTLPSPSHATEMVALIASVTPNDATGIVHFMEHFEEGDVELGSASLTYYEDIDQNNCWIDTNQLAVGTHELFAYYEGDSNYDGSTSPIVAHTVIKDDTLVNITSLKNPTTLGEDISLTIDITTAHGGLNVAGPVRIYLDSVELVNLYWEGQIPPSTVTFTGGFSQARIYTIIVTYEGNESFNPGQGSIEQTVNPFNLPPIAEAGPNQTVEQTSPGGAQVMLDGSGSTDDGLLVPLTYDWTWPGWPGGYASGMQPQISLAPGFTRVTLTVYDGEFWDSDSVDITVEDTTPPNIIPPADITVQQNNPGGATIDSLGTPTVSDAADPDPVVTNNAPTVFPIGVSTVVWTAMDASGNSATATQTVTITPAQNEYTLDVTITGSGTVNRDNNGPYYDGDIVQLTAVPETGWSFTEWGGDLDGSANPASITMDGNKSVTATFTINTYTITATAGNGGSIDPSEDVIVNYGADQSFSINPDTGYQIDDVMVDGVSQGALSSYIFNGVTHDHTIAASFITIGGSIVVTSPNGGEDWEVFSVQTITWTSTGVTGPVKIELSRDGCATWATIFPTTPNDGKQKWIVLRGATTQARIKVSSIFNPALFDISEANFTIVEPSITVTSPNGDESWKIGSTQTITWDSTSVLLVKIELSRDGGATWTTIAASIANHGSKSWKVTGPTTTHARIRVSSLSNSASDISDVEFSIKPK
jgi:hypothetical protein